MRLFLRTAAAFNLLAAPVFGRGISSPNTAPDGSLLADDNVVRFMGGLAVGGTVGYFAGAQQHRRKMKNRQRKPLPDSDPNTPTTTEIDNEQMKTIELETKIHEYLQSDHDGLDWTYECRTLRNPGLGWGTVERAALDGCFSEYLRLKNKANGQRVPPPPKAVPSPTHGEDVQEGNSLYEFGKVDLKNDPKTASPQPEQSFRNFMPSINIGKLNWDAAGASALRQLQYAPELVPEGARPMLHPA